MIRAVICAIILLFQASTARAEGLFDFLDPCIAAKNDYWDARKDIVRKLETERNLAQTEKANPAFRDYWWTEKKRLLREYFDANMADIIKVSGGNADKAFEVWLAVQIQKQGGMPSLDPIIQEEYRKTKQLVLEKKRGATEAQLNETKRGIYKSCPQDVGNQVFRGAVTILSAPVNIVTNNFAAAGRESGDIDKLLRSITGVSVRDIRSNGVCGGSNSEMRKLFGSLC